MMLLKMKKPWIVYYADKEKQNRILVKGWKDNFYLDPNRAGEKGFSIEMSFNSTKNETRRPLKH